MLELGGGETKSEHNIDPPPPRRFRRNIEPASPKDGLRSPLPPRRFRHATQPNDPASRRNIEPLPKRATLPLPDAAP